MAPQLDRTGAPPSRRQGSGSDLPLAIDELRTEILDVFGSGAEEPPTQTLLPRTRIIFDRAVATLQHGTGASVTPRHLLFALLQDEAAVAIQVLRRRGVDTAALRVRLAA